MSRVLHLDDAAEALLEGITIGEVIDAAVSLDKLDRKREPESYRLARLRLVTSAGILAQLTVGAGTLAQYTPDSAGGGSVVVLGDGTRLEAPPPVCAHGLPFSEPCEICEANTSPKEAPPEPGPEVVAGIQP